MPVSMSMQKSNFGSIYIYIYSSFSFRNFIFFVQNFILFFYFSAPKFKRWDRESIIFDKIKKKIVDINYDNKKKLTLTSTIFI